MVLHVTIGTEGLTTAKRARERLLVVMDSQMHFKIRYKGEFLGTTLEGALIVASWYVCSLSLKLYCRKELFFSCD